MSYQPPSIHEISVGTLLCTITGPGQNATVTECSRIARVTGPPEKGRFYTTIPVEYENGDTDEVIRLSRHGGRAIGWHLLEDPEMVDAWADDPHPDFERLVHEARQVALQALRTSECVNHDSVSSVLTHVRAYGGFEALARWCGASNGTFMTDSQVARTGEAIRVQVLRRIQQRHDQAGRPQAKTMEAQACDHPSDALVDESAGELYMTPIGSANGSDARRTLCLQCMTHDPSRED